MLQLIFHYVKNVISLKLIHSQLSFVPIMNSLSKVTEEVSTIFSPFLLRSTQYTFKLEMELTFIDMKCLLIIGIAVQSSEWEVPGLLL